MVQTIINLDVIRIETKSDDSEEELADTKAQVDEVQHGVTSVATAAEEAHVLYEAEEREEARVGGKVTN